MATIEGNGNGGERVMGSEEPIEADEINAVAKRYEAWVDNCMPTPVRMRYQRDGSILLDRHILADAYLSRLSSDRDEAAERAKPIDAEFAVAALGGSMSFAAHALGGATVTVWATRLSPSGFGIGIVHGDTEYVHNLTITTRGQLLDLMRALKGGAT